MEVECLHQFPAELYSPDRVTQRVQGRGPEGHTHHVGDHQEDGATHPGLGGQPHLECKLPAVVVHAARVHQAQHIPHIRGVQNLSLLIIDLDMSLKSAINPKSLSFLVLTKIFT